MTTTTTFVPGNKVKLIDNTGYEDTMTEGGIYTIESTHCSSIYGDDGLVKVEGSACRYFAHRFEAYEPKFKVGDKVKVVLSGYGFGPEFIGQVVTIKEVGYKKYPYYGERKGFAYRIEEHESYGNKMTTSYEGWNGEESFEAYGVEAKPKFAPGTKLRVVDNEFTRSWSLSGMIGDEFVLDTEFQFKTGTRDGDIFMGTRGYWNIPESTVEAVVEPVAEPEAKEAKAFEVGDKVRTLLYYNGVEEGTVGEVTETKIGTFGSVFYRVAGVIFTADELEAAEPTIDLADLDFAALEASMVAFLAEPAGEEFHVEHFGGQTVIRMAGPFDAKRVAAILNAAYAD